MLIAESLRNEEKDKQSKESLDLQVALEKAWMSRSSLREASTGQRTARKPSSAKSF